MINIFLKTTVFTILLLCYPVNTFACSCDSSIEQANDNIGTSTDDFLDAVNDSIDDLNDQLEDNIEEIKNRSTSANSDYTQNLKSLLSKFNIREISENSIEGYLLDVKLSPSTSEAVKLNHFLFEYKKLIQIESKKTRGK